LVESDIGELSVMFAQVETSGAALAGRLAVATGASRLWLAES
jgi:hypothetical protein